MVIVGVVLVALLPRLLGIEFGLPLILHVDEIEPIKRAGELLADGRLTHMNAWRYPPLLAELLALERALAGCLACDPATLTLHGRFIGAIASALAAGLLVDAGRRLKLPLWAAALAGLSFALCPLAVRLARVVIPDPTMTAWVAATVWACVRLSHAGRWRDYLLCGLFGGLAAATKYNAAMVLLMVGVVHLSLRARDARAWLRLCAAAAVSIAVFGATLIWPWAGRQPFVDGLRYEWYHYDAGHAGFDCDNAAWEAIRYLASFALGPIAAAVLLLAALLMLTRRRALTAEQARPTRAFVFAALAYVLSYLALLGRQHVFFARLVMPMLPVLAILLALSASMIADWLTQRLGAQHRPTIVTVLVGLILLAPTIWTVEQVRAVRDTDVRLVARGWLDANLREPDVRLAVLPKSTLAVVPEGIESITVARNLSIARLRQMGVTHVLYGVGSVDRYRWRPERSAEVLASWDDFHARLAAEATLVQRWEHAPLPDAAHFGDSSRTTHHSPVELWSLR